MRQTACLATLTGSLLFGASVAGALRSTVIGVAAMPALHVADGHAQPQVAALAAAIRAQFPGHVVEVAFDAPMLVDAGPAQQEVQALARMRIDGSAPMPMRAVALYDQEARSIAAPSLWFEATGAQPAGDPLRHSLSVAAAHRLGAEFAGQPLAFELVDAQVTGIGGRYLRVLASGTTDFGAEGRAATMVEALYDPRNDEWLCLDYALGADPAPASDGIAYASP